MEQIKRGEIYYANLCPVMGSEQGGIRPVVILQNDKGNLHSTTTIVAPITGELDKPYLRERVCQDDFCKFSKFKYLSAEKSPNISCLHIS